MAGIQAGIHYLGHPDGVHDARIRPVVLPGCLLSWVHWGRGGGEGGTDLKTKDKLLDKKIGAASVKSAYSMLVGARG